MSLTALPDDWILEAGELGLDLDEETGTYLTGARSLSFKPTSVTTRIVSKIEPINRGPTTQLTSRRNTGITLVYQADGFYNLGDLRFGMRYYDVNGALLSTVTRIAVSSSYNVWITQGTILTPPANAQFARLFVEFTNATTTLLVDALLPYLMPPYAHAVARFESLPVALIPGTSVLVPVDLSVGVSGTSKGSHAVDYDLNPLVTTGYIMVNETGSYQVAVEAELDAFAVGDSFVIEIQTSSSGNRYGQLFAPGIASTALLGSDTPFLAMATVIPMQAGEEMSFWVYQRSGVARNVTDLNAWLTKET